MGEKNIFRKCSAACVNSREQADARQVVRHVVHGASKSERQRVRRLFPIHSIQIGVLVDSRNPDAPIFGIERPPVATTSEGRCELAPVTDNAITVVVID